MATYKSRNVIRPNASVADAAIGSPHQLRCDEALFQQPGLLFLLLLLGHLSGH